MKNIKLIVIVFFVNCLLISGIAKGQSRREMGTISPVKIGSVVLNLGIGAGIDYRGDYSNSPLGVKGALEWGLWHAGPGVITLGAEIGGSFSNGGYYADYRSRTIIFTGRSAWHFGWKVRGLDTYGGLSTGLGFHHYNYKNDINYNYNEVIPVFGVFAGASYFVTPTFGFNAEAGYDITNFQLGVIFKLK
jgi:hypothetical protein